jgi:hypothetical protein
MAIMWPTLGMVSVILAIGLAWTLKEAKVGENVTRLLGFLIAFFGYWYVTSEIHGFDFTVRLTFFRWAVPILLGAGVVISVAMIFKNWRNEAQFVSKNAPRMFYVVILCVLARYFLSR